MASPSTIRRRGVRAAETALSPVPVADANSIRIAALIRRSRSADCARSRQLRGPPRHQYRSTAASRRSAFGLLTWSATFRRRAVSARRSPLEYSRQRTATIEQLEIGIDFHFQPLKSDAPTLELGRGRWINLYRGRVTPMPLSVAAGSTRHDSTSPPDPIGHRRIAGWPPAGLDCARRRR